LKALTNEEIAVFSNIQQLDGSHRKINLSCKDVHQTHRSEKAQVTCNNEINSAPGYIGGYAFAYGSTYEESTIVLCSPFFAPGQEHLKDIVTGLRKGPREDQKDPNKMIGKAKILLHELTHLPAVEGRSESKS
jgi:hypothetical protein